MKYLRTLKPATSKGHYIRNLAVGATMTPSVAVTI
jgi:ribosomal protein L1